jgi:hypothetical protein
MEVSRSLEHAGFESQALDLLEVLAVQIQVGVLDPIGRLAEHKMRANESTDLWAARFDNSGRRPVTSTLYELFANNHVIWVALVAYLDALVRNAERHPARAEGRFFLTGATPRR